ncbi:hypothetical protein EZS27_008954 [termite gut metagenome]|uniref:Glycosyltransferase RgtA/B/C/D-like domain-containing protein n=1 Tax=termite gut metagenome TaxID=433724 RepID=A0A5J4SDJ8_9ZZZZ
MKINRINRFWFTYFFIRLFYLFFTVFIYRELTTLGDTGRYLNRGFNFSSSMFYSSTDLMDCIGGFFGTLFGGNNIISNFFFMLLSFYIIRWTVEKLELKKHINEKLLLISISLPNFCIWTSVCSKEVVGLTFSAILAVLFINFFNGFYKIRKRDWIAFYLCLVFKPQYFPFIFQGLILIYLMHKLRKPLSQLILGVTFITANLLALYLMKDIINEYTSQAYAHFNVSMAASTRDNVFVNDNDFFHKAPLGMFTAFWGPTIEEMLSKPTHLLAGIESLFIVCLFCFLLKDFFIDLFRGRIIAVIAFSYFIVFSGICLLHYPFGIFNPGSAIRYRTNFIFLFLILLLYLYNYYKNHRYNRTRYE